MSLTDILSDELCEKLKDLSVDDFAALARAGSVGLSPRRLREGIHAVGEGEEVTLSGIGGTPKPLNIQAWSFVNDRGQYADTYHLTSARAAELKDLLIAKPEDALKEITEVVTVALRKRGSPKPVRVSLGAIPGTGVTQGGGGPGAGVTSRALKDEIRHNDKLYGMYRFTPEDTGRAGATRFRVDIGGGLYASYQSKVGAVDIARICRVHGRTHHLVVDHVSLWIEGKSPVFGSDIPVKLTFTGKLKPNESPPPKPNQKDKTVAPGGE